MDGVSTTQLQGQRIRRCPGIELQSQCALQGQGAGAGVFSMEVRQGWLRRQQQRQIPSLSVAGTQHGYISPQKKKIATNSHANPR